MSEQNQLDELRRVIRDAPNDAVYYPLEVGDDNDLAIVGTVKAFFATDLKSLEAELTRVEGENKDLRSAVYAGKEVVAARDRENARLTSRVADLELLLEKALASFVVLPSQRFTEKLTDEIEAALKSKEAGEEK